MALPIQKDYEFVAGDTWKISTDYKEDVAGWGVRLMARETVSSDETVIDEEWTIPDNGEIFEVYIMIPASETEELISETSNTVTYVYDLEITNPFDTYVETIIGGLITSHKGVTR